jgi:hypothetical protein
MPAIATKVFLLLYFSQHFLAPTPVVEYNITALWKDNLCCIPPQDMKHVVKIKVTRVILLRLQAYF